RIPEIVLEQPPVGIPPPLPPLGDRLDGEVLRPTPFEIRPAHRRGYRGVGCWPGAVHSHHGLTGAVLQVIHIDTLPLFHQPLQGDLLRIAALEGDTDLAYQFRTELETRLRQRQVDVDARGSRELGIAPQT